MSITLMLLLFVVLLFLGLPVGFTIGITSLLAIVIMDFDVSLITQRVFVGLDSFPMMALPMFILAGNLMSGGGITDRLWIFAKSALGFIRGASGYVSVVTSMLFAAMSGSALATVGGLGKLQIDGMVEDGFKTEEASAITAAASTIGPIIPPSIVFVLYGVLAGVSIGRLFMAGMVPGILMGLAIMGYIAVRVNRNKVKYVKRPMCNSRELASAFITAIPPLMTPVIILGGILAGLFTPTEAAAVSSAYALGLGIIYREFTLKSLYAIILGTAKTSAAIMLIIGFANGFSWLLTVLGASEVFYDFITGYGDSKIMILLLVNLALLVVGCFIETNSAVILLTPVLAPALVAIGLDAVHIGIILSINLLIGILTPPMGMALYIVQRIGGAPFNKIVGAVMPLIFCLLLVQLVVTFIPALSLALPKLIMG
ncbi:TRAP dicarboxylate transporter subunit DctM [uncultured delta proteobacterium]|uniref:TRAP dicarboxylate transporter subunit DctM n=1 Tax=uncultured delta proteobacterium TaxID=34034 RepID=A0A212JMP0_9DELT|nr:TRAP dicarboxylate transporter subunit DctM [uncultured delta proteobacterium]